MAEIFFPEKMEHTEGMNADEILKIHDDYIRYIVERIDFAFNGYTNKKKFFQAVEDVVEDGPLAKELENEKSAREQAINQLNEKLQDAGGLFTTVDPETGIVYMHDKKEEPGLLPPYTESRNVIMISTAGIAVSNDGGVTYPMGFTLDDGVAILNKIYAIGIDADHITTGRITDAQGNYSLDLETGTVNMANANITGGNINIETSSSSIDKIALRLNSSAIDYEMLMSVNRIQSDAKFHRFDADGNPLDGYGTEMRSSLGYGGASANVVFKDSDGNESGNYTTTISGTRVSTLKSVNGNSHTISELGSDGSTAGNPQLVLNNPSNGNQTVKLNKDGINFYDANGNTSASYSADNTPVLLFDSGYMSEGSTTWEDKTLTQPYTNFRFVLITCGYFGSVSTTIFEPVSLFGSHASTDNRIDICAGGGSPNTFNYRTSICVTEPSSIKLQLNSYTKYYAVRIYGIY